MLSHLTGESQVLVRSRPSSHIEGPHLSSRWRKGLHESHHAGLCTPAGRLAPVGSRRGDEGPSTARASLSQDWLPPLRAAPGIWAVGTE